MNARDTETRAADIILRLAAECGPGRSLSPAEAARGLAPEGEDATRHIAAVRAAAVALARDGRIVITRKGKPVDPLNFKGVWRFGLPG